MEEDPMFSDDQRSMELSAIAAIFPEIEIDPSSPFEASLTLPVVPSRPLDVCFDQPPDPSYPYVLTPPASIDTGDVKVASSSTGKLESTSDIPEKDVHTLSYLPPLDIKIKLPEGYPYETPPIFDLNTHPQWLSSSRISNLVDDGYRLWEEGGREPVVFTYIDHLQQAAETSLLGVDDGEVFFPRDLKIALLDFNIKAKREKFEQETFECGVCLEPRKGTHCYRISRCGHVFCVSCLKDFYNTCITEGDIDGVKCLDPGCGKDRQQQASTSQSTDAPGKKRKKNDQTLKPSELLQIPLEHETVKRYVFLKRKKKLEADKSTVYCPRQWCQGAARSKKHPKPIDPITDDLDGSDEEGGDFVFDPMGEESQLPPMADRVAICEDCGYAFCSVCKKCWHSELARCFPRRQAELSAEEKATEEYLKLYTSTCPTCNAPCQKRMGCNHMICFKCGTHFCYLCSAWISEENPYRHFNTFDSKCYNRLWDLEGGDGLNPEGADALHQIPEHLLIPSDEDEDEEDGEPHPVWEFDDDDDDDDDDENFIQIHHEPGFPPPPAPVPPGNFRGEAPNANVPLDPVGLAAAAEVQQQMLAMAQVRNRAGAGAV